MRFIDIKTDYAFKKVFGSENSKEILFSFLNSISELNYKIIDMKSISKSTGLTIEQLKSLNK